MPRVGPGDAPLRGGQAVFQKFKEKFSIQDEPSFAALPTVEVASKGSYSARKADSFDFEVVVKASVLSVAIRDKSKEIPSAMFDKLRDIATKAAGRL